MWSAKCEVRSAERGAECDILNVRLGSVECCGEMWGGSSPQSTVASCNIIRDCACHALERRK